MNFLKYLAAGFENAMYAVTFAEAGEFETARKSMREESHQKKTLVRQKRGTVQRISPNTG